MILLILYLISLGGQDETVRWFDYGEALAEARRTQKPLLVEFRCEP
jgi:hypothetical protein